MNNTLQAVASPVMVFEWQTDGHLTLAEMNANAQLLTGMVASKMTGHSIAEVFAKQMDANPSQPVLEAFSRAANFSAPQYVETQLRGPCGYMDVQIHINPAFDGTTRRLVVTLQDISQQRALMRQLEDAQTSALFHGSVKTQFLSVMSHELRTPLNAILGFADMMRQNVMGVELPGRYKGYVQDIFNSAENLLEQIDQLLELSVLEHQADNTPEAAVSVDIARITQDCVQRVLGRAQLMGIEMKQNITSPLVATVDPKRFRQVVLSMLANAIKSTPSGSEVCVRLYAGDDGAVLCVEDAGQSATTDAMNLDQSAALPETAAHAGANVGLGLSLVRRLAHLHGGDLQVESRPGHGTQTRFVLPRNRVLGNVALANPAQDMFG